MRVLLAIVVLAALAWSGWWYWGATTRRAALESWLAERRADGWVAEAETIEVAGFPNRLDAVIGGLELADPDSGWSWSAPIFEILSLSYQPFHVIAVWPGEQSVASPYQTVTVAADRFRGSVVFDPSLALNLNRTALEIDSMTLTGASGWTAAIDSARFGTRQSEPAVPSGYAHDLGFVAEGLRLPRDLVARVDRAGVLPEAIEVLNLDATLTFDRPLDRAAVEDENPRLQALDIDDISINWGRLDLRGRGELVADARGYAEGRIDLRARNWREMLELAVGAGMIGASVASAVEAGLGLIATLSGDGNSIEVPLTFEGGDARLGPIGIGDAPRFTGG